MCSRGDRARCPFIYEARVKETFPTQFTTTEQQLAVCVEILETCRQSNEPLTQMIAALASILSTTLKDESQGWL